MRSICQEISYSTCPVAGLQQNSSAGRGIPAGVKGDQDLENEQILGGAPTPLVLLDLEPVATGGEVSDIHSPVFPSTETSQGHIQRFWGWQERWVGEGRWEESHPSSCGSWREGIEVSSESSWIWSLRKEN